MMWIVLAAVVAAMLFAIGIARIARRDPHRWCTDRFCYANPPFCHPARPGQ